MARAGAQRAITGRTVSLLGILLVFGLIVFSTITRPVSGSKEDASAGEPYSILIVAGQSNASGAESLVSDPSHNIDVFGAQTVLPADTQVQMLFDNSFGNNSLNKGTLVKLNILQQPDTNTAATFGPEVGLARKLYELGRRRVIILKVTAGGTPLAQDPNTTADWNVHSTNEMYKRLKDRYKTLTDFLDNQGAKYNVDGFYWIQGESDVNKEDFAAAYETNLRDLVSTARTDFSMSDTAKFVIGKISTATSIGVHHSLQGDAGCAPYTCAQLLTFNDEVRAAQQAVADSVPGTTIVDTAPLARTGLGLHLSNVSQLELGKELAESTELTTDKKLPVQKESIVSGIEEWNRIYNPNIQPEIFHRDGGSSVRLGNSILWMFGDTFYSVVNADNGKHARSSTAATAPINDPFNLSEPVDANGAPYQFLPLNDEERQYNADSTNAADRYIKWPGNAVNTSPTEAYVYYQHIKSSPSGATNLGVGIARVSEGQTVATDVNESLFPPDQLYLPAVAHNGTLYLRYCQGVHLNFDQICATAKVPVDQLTDRSKYLFWDGDSWNPNIDSAVFEAPGRGFAMMWSDYLGKYVMLSTRAFSGSVTMRTADRPQGPWSDAEHIYNTLGSKYSAIFYAHPELNPSDGKTLAFSFVKEETDQNMASSIYGLRITLADGIDNGLNAGNGGGTGGQSGGGTGVDDGPEDTGDTTPRPPLTGLISRAVVGVSMMFAAGAFLASAVYGNREGSKKSEK